MDEAADLFGDSESEEEEEQQQQQASKKDKLAALAQKKRKEAAELESEKAAKRAHVSVDEGYDDGVVEEGGEELPAAQEESDLGEEEEGEVQPTAADEAFIDDEGVPEDDVNAPWAAAGGDEQDGDGDAAAPEAEEAEEGEPEDEIERAFAKKSKRGKGKLNDSDIKEFIEDFLARMDAAKDVDNENNAQGQAALEKVKLLPDVEAILAKAFMHRDFLDAGLMGTLRDWLYPLPDGSLPNIRLRTSLLRLLAALPIDTSLDHRKEQLKKSALGEVVMFYYKLPDETPANRKLAKALVEKWSKPIYDAYKPLHDEERRAEEARLLAAQQQRRDEAAAASGTPVVQAALKPGDPGFRWHARVPQAASLDYVRRPETDAGLAQEAARGRASKGQGARLQKKLKGLGKGKASSGRAATVSVEGRRL